MHLGRRAVGRAGLRAGVGLVLVMPGLAGCWRQPGYDALHQGWNPIEEGLTAANAATLTEAWTASVDDPPVRSDPVRSGVNHIHVSDDQAAYALDARSGTRVWRTQVVPANSGSSQATTEGVTSDESKVHVAWGNQPDNGQLVGAQVRLDAATGAALDSRDRLLSPRVPTLAGPWRVWPFAGTAELTLGIAGVTVEGPTSWTAHTDYRINESAPVPTSPAVLDDRFFVGLRSFYERTNLLAGWYLAGPPGGSCPSLRCEPDIETPLNGAPTAPVVAADKGTVYTATSAGTVYAIDATTGAVRWTANAGGPVSQPLAWTPDALYVVNDSGVLSTLDPDGCGRVSCTPLAWTLVDDAPVAAPAVAGGVVYVASGGGFLAAFDADDLEPGEYVSPPIWSTTVAGGAEITGGPTVANGQLLVGTGNGRVVAFAPSSRQPPSP
jgi:outer membrane protein assembly factor BamB